MTMIMRPSVPMPVKRIEVITETCLPRRSTKPSIRLSASIRRPLVDYWQSPGVAGRGGLISDQEFASYIDWYVRIGQLKPGEVKASDVYNNRLNPFREVAAK